MKSKLKAMKTLRCMILQSSSYKDWLEKLAHLKSELKRSYIAYHQLLAETTMASPFIFP